MKFRFRPEDIEACDISTKGVDIESCDNITAADEGKKSMEDVVGDKLDALSDDFDYAVAGLDKLCRDGQFEEAMGIINALSESLGNAIAQIGGTFESEA